MSDCVKCSEAVATAATVATESDVETCPATGFQRVSVCVPVTITPFAKTGKTKTTCCGDPVVVSGDTPCAGKKNGVCTFTIS